MEVVKYTKEVIKEKISSSNQWLIRGAQAIYARQTLQEKSIEETIEENGVGFNGVDAKFCSSLVMQWNQRRSLSEKQWFALRKCMQKYCGQLALIANGGA